MPVKPSRSREKARHAQDALHGNAPDSSEVALLLVDVINDFEFPGGERLARRAKALASRLSALKARARRARVPCIYANDNFGRWRSDFSAQVRHCLEDGVRGAFLAEALRPAPDDYFVLKPKHSAFYQTCLELLLSHLGTKTLVIAGVATDNCVLFTAADAYLRGHQLIVVKDGCAALGERAHHDALKHMTHTLKARPARCTDVIFSSHSTGARVRLRTKP
jgi:nicotinamidase-related amidase